MNDTVRVNLVVDTTTKERIKRMMDKTGSKNMTQTIREALLLYEEAIDNALDNGKLVMESADGSKTYYKIHVVSNYKK